MRGRRNRGFSLLETLAAMLLLAICFGALMHATSASMALSTRANDYTQASMWASGLLDRIFVTEFPAEGLHTGKFDATYRWSMKVETLADSATLPTSDPLHLYRVELTVEWSEDGKPAKATFATSRLVSMRVATPPAKEAAASG